MIIAFEGVDGAGKSTAALDLSAELTKQHIDNVLISSASLREEEIDDDDDDEIGGVDRSETERVIRRIWLCRDQLEESFGPRALCLSNAWEFAYRWESLGVPALESGKVVIADRYTDTALVREVLRGIDEKYVRAVYAFAPPPDLVLYLDLDPEVAYQRKTKARLVIGYFEAGRDVIRGARSLRMSFVSFQSKCRQRYGEILARDNVVRIDASRSPKDVQSQIVETVLARLNAPRKTARRRSS